MSKKRYQLVAIAYDKKGKVLCTGLNNYRKTHPIQAYFAQLVGEPNKIYLHAEIAAMIKAGMNKIEEIYVSSLSPQKSCRPCPICRAAGRAFGVKRFIYDTENGIKSFEVN